MYVMEAELIARLNGCLVRLASLTDQAATLVNNGLRWLPAAVQQDAMAAWERLCANLRAVWDQLRQVLSWAGSPSALREAARAWTEQVAGPVSGLAGYASPDQTDVHRHWAGDAAHAYLETLPAQRRAIEHISSGLCVPASAALDSMARAILVFWTTVIGAFTALFAGLVGALATKATIVGIPAGIAVFLGAVAVFSAAVLTASLMLQSDAAGATNQLRQQLHDNSVLPGNSWPRSTTVA